MKEQTLSKLRKYTKKDGLFDKLRCHALDKHIIYKEEDVKDFIKKLKEQFYYFRKLDEAGLKPKYEIFSDYLDKLAGETLTK
jgi:hypothetical protein